MRLCNSRLPEEHFVCHQMSQRNWVIIKVLYRCLQRYLLGWRISRFRLSKRYLWAHSVMHIIISLASIATNELVAGWCIKERVKRLAGNEIELGIEIPTIESRESNILVDKGNYVCCHNGSTDKDLHRICGNQYDQPGSAVGYWPKRCLGHVYIVLEPVGSACLKFVDDIVWVMYVGY